MRWNKLGLVYLPDGSNWWARSHAMIPTPLIISDQVIRLFITCCDEKGIGRVGYLDVDASNPTRVLNVGQEPLLDIGKAGTFDENGALVCSVVSLPNDMLYLYYAGFELGRQIRYRLLTGLACQEGMRGAFLRMKQTPVLERSDKELYFRGGPFVVFEAGRFRMWYVAGSSWERVEDAVKPVYEIRYVESIDGINWPDEGETCIRIEKDNEHGFGRPYVLKVNGLYRMFYSVRRRDVASYRLGYAESVDGKNWIRKDETIGLDVSSQGWDSEMICYSAVIDIKGRCYMFYNGNDFGKSGFGVAELQSW